MNSMQKTAQIRAIVNKEGEYGEYDDKPNRFTSQSRLQFLIHALKYAFENPKLGSVFLDLKKGSHLYRTINSENKKQMDIYGTQQTGKTAHFMNSSLLGNIYIDLMVKNDSFMKLQVNRDIKLLDLRYAHHIFGSQMKGGVNDRGIFNCFEEKALKYVAQIFKCQGVILYDLADMQTPQTNSTKSYIAKTGDAWYVTSKWRTLLKKSSTSTTQEIITSTTQEIIQINPEGYLAPEIFITDTSVLDIVDDIDILPVHKIPIKNMVDDDDYEGKFIFKYEGITNTIYEKYILDSFFFKAKTYPGLTFQPQFNFKIIEPKNRESFLTKVLEYLKKINKKDDEILDLVNDKMELKSIGTKAGYKPENKKYVYECQKPGKNIRNVNQLKSYLFNHVLNYSKYMINTIYTSRKLKITLLSILISWRFDYMNSQSQTSTDFRDNLKVLFNLENRYFEYNEPVQKYIKFLCEAIGNILDQYIETIRKTSNEAEAKATKPNANFRRHMYYLEDAYKQKWDGFNQSSDKYEYFANIYDKVNIQICNLFNIESHKNNVYVEGSHEKFYKATFLMRHFFQFYLKGGTCMRMLYYSSGEPESCTGQHTKKICWEEKGEKQVNEALGDLSDFDYNISINAFLKEHDYNLVKSMLAKIVIDVFKDFAKDMKWNPAKEYQEYHKDVSEELKSNTIKKDDGIILECPIIINDKDCEQNIKLSLKDNELVQDMKGFYTYNIREDKFKKVDQNEKVKSIETANTSLQKHLYIQASELDFASSGAKFTLLRLMYQYNTFSVGGILSGCETQVELIDVSIIAFCALEKLDTWLHAKPKFLNLKNITLESQVPRFDPQTQTYSTTDTKNVTISPMTSEEIKDNKGFLIRGGHVKIINFKNNNNAIHAPIPLYDLTYAIQDLELVIKENKAQGRLKKLAKREKRKNKLAPLLCIWNTKDVSEHTKHMCTDIMLGTKMSGDTRLNYVFGLFKTLMASESPNSKLNIKENTNTAGAWIFCTFCRWYNSFTEKFKIPVYDFLIKENLGALAYRHLCINIIFNIPFVHKRKFGTGSAHVPSFDYVIKSLLKITLEHMNLHKFNSHHVENFNKTYLYKAKHFSFIPEGLTKSEFKIYSDTLFSGIINVVKILLTNDIYLFVAYNAIYSLETFMNVVDNYGCLVLNINDEQKDKVAQTLKQHSIKFIQSKNINKEIDNECFLIKLNDRISLILYICNDQNNKIQIITSNYQEHITNIQNKYTYILNTLDSSDPSIDTQKLTEHIHQLQKARERDKRRATIMMQTLAQQNQGLAQQNQALVQQQQQLIQQAHEQLSKLKGAATAQILKERQIQQHIITQAKTKIAQLTPRNVW
jgi:hypothetical protein